MKIKSTNEYLPPELVVDYLHGFRELAADVELANLCRVPLCPCREPEIEAATKHEFSVWLDRNSYFRNAKLKIEIDPYYLGVIPVFRQRWWIELKYKLAGALFAYHTYQDAKIIDAIKEGVISAPLLADGRNRKRSKKARVSKLATELLSEINGCYVLPTIFRNHQLHTLLRELVDCLETGDTSRLGLSRLHQNVAREAMIKQLAIASAIFTGDIFNSIICDLVNIATETDMETVNSFIAGMRSELSQQRKEMYGEAARLTALREWDACHENAGKQEVDDICPVCHSHIPPVGMT